MHQKLGGFRHLNQKTTRCYAADVDESARGRPKPPGSTCRAGAAFDGNEADEDGVGRREGRLFKFTENFNNRTQQQPRIRKLVPIYRKIPADQKCVNRVTQNEVAPLKGRSWCEGGGTDGRGRIEWAGQVGRAGRRSLLTRTRALRSENKNRGGVFRVVQGKKYACQSPKMQQEQKIKQDY